MRERLGRRDPFSDRGAPYSGAHDEVLDAGVERFTAGPPAVRDQPYGSGLAGRAAVPAPMPHAEDGPAARVGHGAACRHALRGAHRERRLVRTFSDGRSAPSGAERAAPPTAPERWARTGQWPVAAAGHLLPRVRPRARHRALPRPGAPAYRPASHASRVGPRPGNTSRPAMTAAREKGWSRVPGTGIAPGRAGPSGPAVMRAGTRRRP
ncbi:hypothetical protein [Streptomyces sp. NPDC093991]|uniref:hypothetical protein n=1 Tax=unclassified Streptomyces TaxID=2593676 RepID=UPI003418EB51